MCQCWKLIYEFSDFKCERHRLTGFDLIRFRASGLNEKYKCDLFAGFAKQSDDENGAKDLLAAFTAATSSADGATADGEEGS